MNFIGSRWFYFKLCISLDNNIYLKYMYIILQVELSTSQVAGNHGVLFVCKIDMKIKWAMVLLAISPAPTNPLLA